MSWKSFFHVVFYKTQRLYVHFVKIFRAQRLYVHFEKILRAQRLYVQCPHLCSKRIGRYVIIHDVNFRQDGVEPVGMLKVRPSQEEINNSIRPNNSCGCQNAERFPCYTTSPATKSNLGPPSDCASIRPTCNLTIIINNTNHYNHSGHSNLERPGASAAEYSGRNTKNYFCDGKYFCRCI